MAEPVIGNFSILPDKKVYFASDFHLGAPDPVSSRQRERLILSWLNSIKTDASALFLLGDLFDFWFEYKKVVPKGYVRFLARLGEFADNGIPVFIFTGNHDLWMNAYFTEELGIPVFRKPVSFCVNNIPFHVGHGDGLGPGDHHYKRIKQVFTNPLCQKLFRMIHPDIGVQLANYLSGSSRKKNNQSDDGFKTKEEEWIWQYCREEEDRRHHQYYVFGHRHIPLNLEVNAHSQYINLGEWVNHRTFASFNGRKLVLNKYQGERLPLPSMTQ